MNNFKQSRNLWLFSGFCFMLTFILNLLSNKFAVVPVLNGVTCILCFINAYNNHKRIVKDKKDNVK